MAGAARTGTTARTAAELAPTSTSIASGVTASGGTSRSRNSASPACGCPARPSPPGASSRCLPHPPGKARTPAGSEALGQLRQAAGHHVQVAVPAVTLSPTSANLVPSRSGRIVASGANSSGPVSGAGRCAMTLAHRTGNRTAAAIAGPGPARRAAAEAASRAAAGLSAAIRPASISALVISPRYRSEALVRPSWGSARMASASTSSSRSAGRCPVLPRRGRGRFVRPLVLAGPAG